MHSLEELEARMRGGAPPPTSSTDQPRVNKTEEDLSAFKKLVILYVLYIQIYYNKLYYNFILLFLYIIYL